MKDKSAGGAIIAAAPGRIDLSNADQFQVALSASLAKAGTALVLDLSAADLITSGGFRVLVIVQKASKAQNKSFAITSLRPLVKEVYDIGGFKHLLVVFDTVHDAVAKLDPDSLPGLDAP
ncbi:MAG: STAS domain-containing protein [Alphaproteobacteria bacterium]|nr:STAS domain-containing protein [Alphaproteobacteria bacterium]